MNNNNNNNNNNQHEPNDVLKSVPVCHLLMTQTLGPSLIKKVQSNWSRDIFSSKARFDELTKNMEWNDGQLQVQQSVLKDLYHFFHWRNGAKKNKSKLINMEEAKALILNLRSMLFESFAVVCAVPEVESRYAVRVQLPNKLIQSLFPIYENEELIYHHELLRKKLRSSSEEPTPESNRIFRTPTAEMKSEWPTQVKKKMKKDGVVYTSFEKGCLASAYYGSAAKSKTMKLGNEVKQTQNENETCLIEEYMKLMWNCCTHEGEQNQSDIAYRFYFLASQTWFPIGIQPEDNMFYLPQDYKEFVQAPHVDYSSRRDYRVNAKDRRDMWSMDLPLTVEGCTIMIWPHEGNGIACHAKYNEVILRSHSLVHSGGIPGRNNQDAFRLHGALGSEKYLAEIDGTPQTFKQDRNRQNFDRTYTFPNANEVIQAVNERYL